MAIQTGQATEATTAIHEPQWCAGFNDIEVDSDYEITKPMASVTITVSKADVTSQWLSVRQEL